MTGDFKIVNKDGDEERADFIDAIMSGSPDWALDLVSFDTEYSLADYLRAYNATEILVRRSMPEGLVGIEDVTLQKLQDYFFDSSGEFQTLWQAIEQAKSLSSLVKREPPKLHTDKINKVLKALPRAKGEEEMHEYTDNDTEAELTLRLALRSEAEGKHVFFCFADAMQVAVVNREDYANGVNSFNPDADGEAYLLAAEEIADYLEERGRTPDSECYSCAEIDFII